MTENFKKLAYLNDTMGPYHYARLEAANKFLKCIFIEFSSRDHTNLWEGKKTKYSDKVILFKDKPITEQNYSDIKSRLYNELDIIKPDVVLVFGWDSICSLLAIIWCLNENVPIIMLSESQEIDFKRNAMNEYVKSKLLKLIDSAFVGGLNQEKYLVKLGFDSSKIFKGCDIVDNSYFTKKSFNIRKKAKYYIDKCKLPDKYFFVVCRLVKKKNINTLIKTFKLFLDQGFEWSLVIAGEGPEKEILENLAIKLKIAHKVKFLGYVEYDQIPIYYALSKCFVLPSITEQWGLVVNEALASGTPVIVSNRCGSSVELVKGNNVGFTFDPYFENDLLEKMIEMTDESVRDTFSLNTSDIIKRYNDNHFGTGLKQAFDSAIINYNKNKSVFSKILLRILIIIKRLL